MDKRILLTIFFVILIVGGILLFKVLFPPCSNPVIQVLTEHPMAGQVVSFTGTTEDEEDIQWDFGDSSFSSGTEGMHVYKSSGTYTVTAKAGECAVMKQITVDRIRDTVRVMPVVNLPESIYGNERVTFRDETQDALRWNWRVLETQESGTSSSFSAIFRKAGKYTVSLSLQGEYVKGDTSFSIIVLPPKQIAKAVPAYIPPKPKPAPKPAPVSPPPPKPAPAKPAPVKTSPYWPDDKFRATFINVANSFSDESSSASEDWKAIVDQGCNQTMSVYVIEEQKSKQMSLEKFKTIMIAEGGFYVSEVEVLKRSGGPGTCITTIRVHTKNN